MRVAVCRAGLAVLACVAFAVAGDIPNACGQRAAARPAKTGKARLAGKPLGSPDFNPSPERPVGWRGDGTGRYPAATPPTTWQRKRSGAGYTATGILWAAPLPNNSVASPIIVGDKIFLTAEFSDLVCLDKHSGRILWIRSNFESEGLSAAERKANPAYAEKIDPLLPQLAAANAEAVKALNALQAGAATTASRPPAGAWAKKRELEKRIKDEQLAIYKKDEYRRYGAQGVFGYSGPTPTSDGTHVFAFFTTGVSVCYDMDGHRKWIKQDHGGGAEHGNFASPLLCANQFVVWANESRSYDAETGKLLWRNGDQGGNTYGSMFRIQVGNELVAAFQNGYFNRLSDGKVIWDKHLFADQTSTPIVEGRTVYAYGRQGGDAAFNAYLLPSSTDGGKLAPAFNVKTDWTNEELSDKDFKRGCTASPLYVDGLLYRLTEGGGLIVNDAANGNTIYRKVLPMKPRTEYWGYAGASASPTLAGKYIYLMDNQGTTVVIQPGKKYKEVAKNMIEEIEKADWKAPGGKSQEQMLTTPVFEGARMYYRSPGYLYCIGEE